MAGPLNLGPLNVLLQLQGANRFGKQANDASSAIGGIGKAVAGLAAGFTIKQFVQDSVTAFAEFERGMTRVGAVTNSLGSEAFAGLTVRAQELAATTEFTARQVADAMGFMGMAGMKTNDIYSATPAVLQLASAGMVDVASAADTVTNIMAGYQMSVDQLTDANNVLVATFTGSNTSLQSLGEAFKYAGPVAKSAGISFKEAAAMIGLMGNAGVQGSMAGTSLRNALLKLQAPTKEGAAIMKRFGIETKDAAGKLKPLNELFAQFAPLAEDAVAMQELFGIRGMVGMQAALGQGADALDNLSSKIENAGNIAERVANAQLETLDGKIKIMKSNFEALQIAMGKGLEPATESLVSALSTAAQFAKYIAEVISFAREDQEDTAIDEAITKLAKRREELSKMLSGLQNAASLGAGADYISQALPAYRGLSVEAATGGLEMRIAELTDQIAKLGKRGLKVEMPKAPKIPSATTPKAPKIPSGGMSEKAAAAVAIAPVAPIIEATASELEYLADLVGFANNEILVFGDEVASLGDETRAAAESVSRFNEEATQAIIDGIGTASRAISSRGMGFGPEIGEAIGSAIGSFAGSPQIGGALGQVIGQLFGPVLDTALRFLQTLEPVFDVLNRLLTGLLIPVVVALAPTFERLAANIAFLLPLTDALGWAIGFAEYGLSQFAVALENIRIWFENLFILDENAKKPYKEFTSVAEYMAEVEAARAAVTAQLNDETQDTVESFRELNEELSNVPIGIKKLQFKATRADSPLPSRWTLIGAW